MHRITISIDPDMADQFMLAKLRITGDTAIWCIRQTQIDIAKKPTNDHLWEDVHTNMQVLNAVNVLLEHYGKDQLSLAEHVSEYPLNY